MLQAEKPKENMETQQLEQQQNHVSMSNNVAKDLLQRFFVGNQLNHKLHEETEEEEEEDIELSLGLSLNGRFGVDPRARKLSRSSSIPDFINPKRENGSRFVVPMVSTNLLRSCSLPTEAEEWRKRKEMQMLRRMEAKRKRSEKQRNLKAVKDRNRGFREEINGGEDKKGNTSIGSHHQQNDLLSTNGEGLLPPAIAATPLSQRSNGSHGGRSSGTLEFESQPVQGMNKCSEARSPASVQSLTDCEQKLSFGPGSTLTEKSGRPSGVTAESNGSNKSWITEKRTKEMVSSVLYDMPCVTTKGDGPNGKRIQGFLYRYRKGEELKIVCVCHGSFLSPSEFVKHAGGGDVAEPLKHIVVSPCSLL